MNNIETMKQVLGFLEHLTTHRWTLQDQTKAIELQRQAIEQAQKQEPVAWMDGYRNIYSLEEKAAGCPEATIALGPMANQEKTSGSPINELQCVCGAVWCGNEMVHLPNKKPPRQPLTDEQKDAARWRFLVDNSFDKDGVTQFHVWEHSWEPHSQTGEQTEWKQRVRGPALDRFIDRAIEAAHGIKENT